MTKEAKAYIGAETVSSINGAGTIGQVHARKNKQNGARPPTDTVPRNKLKWIKGI